MIAVDLTPRSVEYGNRYKVSVTFSNLIYEAIFGVLQILCIDVDLVYATSNEIDDKEVDIPR
jgi:hypothetical protein